MNDDQIKLTTHIVGYSLAVLGGGLVGYAIAAKRLSIHYSDIANEEIASVKEYYSKLRKEGDYSTPESARSLMEEKSLKSDDGNYVENLEDLKYAPIQDTNAVEDSRDSFTAREGIATPVHDSTKEITETSTPSDPNNPYVIWIMEFMEDRDDYDKTSLSYYEEDDTLVDERDEILDDVEGTVGSDALTKFGLKSTDENVVYVRNERLHTDFEVLRNPGSFTEVIDLEV